ncbi:MAG: response regulator [Holophagales bacterium]|nr:response regulator [Holophagales bacterium]
MAKTILLIEYEPRYLDRIKGYLAGKDFDLVVAKDGEDGLEAYRRARPDLVLISTVLPKLRTRDVIRGMQALGATPPVLLMASGYKGKDKKADAAREGATGILEKPFAEEALLAEISAALGGRSHDPFPGAGAQPLLSADDIFSDVISGVEAAEKEEKARPRTGRNRSRNQPEARADALGHPVPSYDESALGVDAEGGRSGTGALRAGLRQDTQGGLRLAAHSGPEAEGRYRRRPDAHGHALGPAPDQAGGKGREACRRPGARAKAGACPHPGTRPGSETATRPRCKARGAAGPEGQARRRRPGRLRPLPAPREDRGRRDGRGLQGPHARGGRLREDRRHQADPPAHGRQR